MRLWHTHRWIEHARTWAEPRHIAVEKGVHCSEALFERSLAGVTTFIFRCRGDQCGALRKIEALGRDQGPFCLAHCPRRER